MTLSVNNLSVHYGVAEILRDINFSLPPGTVTALIGPNGTGKSTLLKAVARLIPAGGTVALEGHADLTQRELGRSIAYMPQDTGAISSLTILEVVLLGRLHSLGLHVPRSLHVAAGTALAQFGLADLETRTLDTVSGGQRQLVYLAQALFRGPPVLLLDEPTAALDLHHQLSVLDAIRKHTRSRRIITMVAMHDLTLAARFADSIICLSNGRLVSNGEPETVLTPGQLRDIYRVETEVGKTKDGLITVTPLRST